MEDIIYLATSILSLTEIILRIVPTKKPFSVLFYIHELLRKIDEAIPNNVLPEHDKLNKNGESSV